MRSLRHEVKAEVDRVKPRAEPKIIVYDSAEKARLVMGGLEAVSHPPTTFLIFRSAILIEHSLSLHSVNFF